LSAACSVAIALHRAGEGHAGLRRGAGPPRPACAAHGLCQLFEIPSCRMLSRVWRSLVCSFTTAPLWVALAWVTSGMQLYRQESPDSSSCSQQHLLERHQAGRGARPLRPRAPAPCAHAPTPPGTRRHQARQRTAAIPAGQVGGAGVGRGQLETMLCQRCTCTVLQEYMCSFCTQ